MDLRKIIKDILKENEGITPQNLKKREFDIDELFNKKINKIFTFTDFSIVFLFTADFPNFSMPGNWNVKR